MSGYLVQISTSLFPNVAKMHMENWGITSWDDRALSASNGFLISAWYQSSRWGDKVQAVPVIISRVTNHSEGS